MTKASFHAADDEQEQEQEQETLRKKVPPLSVEERESQTAVKAAVEQLLAVRESLAVERARFEKIPSERAMSAGLVPGSVAFMLRISIECLLYDRLDPLIRDLKAAGEITPLGLVREWKREGRRQPDPAKPAVEPATAIHIREGEAKDLEAMYRLGLASPALQPSATAPFLEKDELPGLLRDVFLVVEVGGNLVGFLVAEIHGPLGYLALLTVAPAFRRQGVARKLLEECAVRLRKKGVLRLGGFAFQDKAVQRFLARLGATAGKSYTWMDRGI